MNGWKKRYKADREEYVEDNNFSNEHSGFLFHDQGEFAEFTDVDDDIYVR